MSPSPTQIDRASAAVATVGLVGAGCPVLHFDPLTGRQIGAGPVGSAPSSRRPLVAVEPPRFAEDADELLTICRDRLAQAIGCWRRDAANPPALVRLGVRLHEAPAPDHRTIAEGARALAAAAAPHRAQADGLCLSPEDLTEVDRERFCDPAAGSGRLVVVPLAGFAGMPFAWALHEARRRVAEALEPSAVSAFGFPAAAPAASRAVRAA